MGVMVKQMFLRPTVWAELSEDSESLLGQSKDNEEAQQVKGREVDSDGEEKPKKMPIKQRPHPCINDHVFFYSG